MKHVILILALLGAPCAAQAQQDGQPAREFSQKTGDITNGALAFINNGDHSRAFPLLTQALKRPDISAYERATLYQMQGASFYELGDTIAAIDAFQNAIESGGLNSDEAENMVLNIGQLYYVSGEYAKGAQILEDDLGSFSKSKPNVVEIIISGWVHSGNHKKALPWVERRLNMLAQLNTPLGKGIMPIVKSSVFSTQDANLHALLGRAYTLQTQCEEAQAALDHASRLGYDNAGLSMLVAICYYEDANNQEALSCDMTKAQIASAPRTIKKLQSIKSFNRIPVGLKRKTRAEKWIKFIKTEMSKFGDRCEAIKKESAATNASVP